MAEWGFTHGYDYTLTLVLILFKRKGLAVAEDRPGSLHTVGHYVPLYIIESEGSIRKSGFTNRYSWTLTLA